MPLGDGGREEWDSTVCPIPLTDVVIDFRISKIIELYLGISSDLILGGEFVQYSNVFHLFVSSLDRFDLRYGHKCGR